MLCTLSSQAVPRNIFADEVFNLKAAAAFGCTGTGKFNWLAVEITAIKHITTCVYVHVELIKYSKVDCEEF